MRKDVRSMATKRAFTSSLRNNRHACEHACYKNKTHSHEMWLYKLLELFDESNIGLAEQMNYWLNDVCQNNDYGHTNN